MFRSVAGVLATTSSDCLSFNIIIDLVIFNNFNFGDKVSILSQSGDFKVDAYVV